MGEELKRLTALVNNTEKKVNNDNIITSVGLNPNGLKQEKKDEENGQLQSLMNAHRPSIEVKGEKRKIDELKEEGTEDDDSVFLPNDRNKEEGDKSRNKRNRPTESKPVDWDLVDPKTGKNGENKSNTDHNTMMSYHAHGQRFGDHTGGQQHEVFAFSTYLANRAAQTVLGGTSNSIISYHQTQSASRKFLQADQDAQDKTPPSSADSGVAHTSSNNSPEDQSSSRQGTPIPLGTPDPKTQDNLQKPMDVIEPKECRTPKGNNTSSTPEGGNSTPSNSVHNETLTPVSSGHETSTPTPPTTTKKQTGRKRKSSVKGVTKMLQHQQQQHQQQHHQQHYGPHVNPPFQGHFPSQVGYNMNNPFHTDMAMPFTGNQRISPVGVPQPSTTETEDLSPSALWENPPSKKISGPGAWKPQMDMMSNMQNSMMSHPRMNASAKMQHRQLMRPTQFQQHSQGSMGVSLPFGSGVVNSDENLTPDQLRHRQEQLRKLTDMKRILLHDKPGNQMTSPRMMSPGGLPSSDMMMMPENPIMQGMMRTSGPGMMEPPQRIMISPTGMGMNPQHMPMMPQDDMMSPEQRMMMQPPMNNDWENATPAQKAWVKLQHEYYQEKQQSKILGKQPNMMNLAGPNMPMDSHDPMGDFGMNPQGMPGAGNVPPPPPYHGPQTPFVGRQTMGGSFPMSGGMPSNNMPLSPTRLMIAQPGNRTNRTGSMPGIQPQMAFQRSQGNMNMPMSPTPNMQSNSGLDAGLTGSMMEQSPRPGHPGTPGMENFGTTRSNSNNMNPMSQPNVPSPQMPKPNTSSANTGIPTPLSSTPEASMPKTSADTIQQMTKASDVQMGQPQRLVNFPSSQLNRDKAPNFPPRGEEQFASHFYQKPMEKKQPGRLQHYNSNMGVGHEMMPSPQGMISSHGNMMSPQPGMMSSKSGMIALTSPVGQQMGGQSGMMPQQRMNSSQAQMRIMPQDMMTSQALTTSQSNMMSSHSSMMPSQSATMNSQSDMMTSSQGMMSPMGMMPQQPGFIGNQRTMVSPGNNIAPGMNMPNMGNHGLMGNPGNMPGGMGMPDMGMPNMGMPNEGNMGHGMMPEHGMGTSSIPNDVISMQQQGNTVMRNNNRSMGSSNNQVPLPASLPIDASSRTTPNMTGQKMNSGAAPNTPSSGDSQNPLAILQNRFEPPLLPDGKGPKQTLQYFPTPDAQAQSGNPHLNPGMNPGPVSQPPSQGPKQIQMPFPMDMVRPGMQGMSQGYGPRLSGPRMSHSDAMFQQQMGGMPRNQMTGMYGMSRQMQPDMFVPGRHRMMNPNMMGQQPMGGFSDPVMGGPQGPGGMMAMNNPMMQYQNMPNM